MNTELLKSLVIFKKHSYKENPISGEIIFLVLPDKISIASDDDLKLYANIIDTNFKFPDYMFSTGYIVTHKTLGLIYIEQEYLNNEKTNYLSWKKIQNICKDDNNCFWCYKKELNNFLLNL